MSVSSAQSVVIDFTTSNPSTQAAANADSTPTGTLIVNGADNVASVTVTNKATGEYKAAVTLPTLAVGDVVEIRIAATVAGTAGKRIVWRDTKDVLLDGSGSVTFNNTSIATVTTLTNLPAIPNNWLTAAGIAANALNGKGDWNIGKTGYSLTQAFPANFAALGITAGGKISGVVLVDTTTTNTDMRGTDGAALAAQIPADFTDATFASAGVFSTGALANAPTGGGGGGDVNVVSINGATFAGPNVPCVLADGVAHGGTPGGSTATLAWERCVGASATDGEPAWKMTGLGAGPGGLFRGGASHGDGLQCVGGGSSGNGLVGAGAGNAANVSEAGCGIVGGAAATVGSAGIAGFGDQTPSETFGIVAYGCGDLPAIMGYALGRGSGLELRCGTAGAGGRDVLLSGDGKIWDGPSDRPAQVLSDRVMLTGTLPDQSGSPGPYNVVLPSGPAGTDVLLGSRLRITAGSGQDQERTVVAWNGTTKVAGMDRPFAVAAAAGDSFQVLYDNAPQMSADGANVAVSVFDFQPQALALLFTLDTEKVYADAVAGSVVGEIVTNTASSPPTVVDIRTEMDSNSTKLAHLDADISSRSTYAGGDTSGTTTLLSRVTASVALASQIPANFTDATFASAGVFSVGALANAPTGGGGGSDPWATAEPGAYSSGTFGHLVATDLPAILAKLNAAGSTILIGGTVPDDAGVMKIVRGDGYYLSDGTQIGPFTNTSGLAFNTATSFKFRVFKGASQSSGLLTDSDVSVTGSSGAWSFTADLTEAQTILMTHDQHGWEMVVTLLNGHTRTLARGTLDLSD